MGLDTKPIHSGIKVRTIVNIMKVYGEHIHRVEIAQRKYDYYKSIGDRTEIMFAEIELNKERKKLGEFLDFYI